MTGKQPLYEKMGAFYLGKVYDLAADALTDEYYLYDAKDLVTHGVIVGMTGSGKTGLGVVLLEEAAIDGIPAIIVDPKGDMANLMLAFPDLSPADFKRWIHPDDARREGMDPDDFAARQAGRWREGLQQWDQDADRIARLKRSAEFRVYTPGSDAALPVSVLASFSAPPEVRADAELLRDRIETTVTSLLGLLGIDADPVRSREHILLAKILQLAWSEGRSLDLATLIRHVQQPSFLQVGVLDLETFYPADERFELAMALNNLLASPTFANWLRGEPLDLERMLYSESGKPRHIIFSIAHLSDAERMFFVSLLLTETVSWMRKRSGTSSLRALLYIDEIFGYMPPVARPPSKKPLLTLMKQARAYGLGVVLATQNPIDLDYKGLSNTGTWFIGRLQTERDRRRLLDGLRAVGDLGLNASDLQEAIANLAKRVFLVHNVHEPNPVAFQTRWALSYLAGPMTREQLKRLPAIADTPTAGSPAVGPGQRLRPDRVAVGRKLTNAGSADRASGVANAPPILPHEIKQCFVRAQQLPASPIQYVPWAIASLEVQYVDTRKKLSARRTVVLAVPPQEDAMEVDWSESQPLPITEQDLLPSAEQPCGFWPVPAVLSQPENYRRWKRELTDHVYRTFRYSLWKSRALGEYSRPGESERDFRIRLVEQAREKRDREIAKLRQKYATKIRRLEQRIQRAEHAVDREQQQARAAKQQTVISFGATVLGMFMGRKAVSRTSLGRATAAARGLSRASQQADDVRRAEEKLISYQQELEELEDELAQEIDQLHAQFDPLSEDLETVTLKPRKSDIALRLLGLGWIPHEWRDDHLERLL